MPAFNLFTTPATVARFDVVGQHADGVRRFVKHVALHNADNSNVARGDEVAVAHMGPPLQLDHKIQAHVVGSVPLTLDEFAQIEVWFAKVRDEYEGGGVQRKQWRQYIIHPPWHDERDRNTGVRRYRRYSCAGFVLDGHIQVGIELLDLSENALPPIDHKTLIAAYFEPASDPNEEFLARFGVVGDPPWRIVLAGYVLHALNRPTEEIRQGPYRANAGDECF